MVQMVVVLVVQVLIIQVIIQEEFQRLQVAKMEVLHLVLQLPPIVQVEVEEVLQLMVQTVHQLSEVQEVRGLSIL
jgi:hypothetical protein